MYLVMGVVGIIVLAVALGLVMYVVGLFNALIAVKHDVDRSWANIDVVLKQRYDELPKLLKTVETYMQYEQDTLRQVIEARSRYANAQSVDEKSKISAETQAGLMKIFALAENYPDLKANVQFQELQRRISDLEESLADRREFYNASVNTFNVRIEQIPDVVLARIMNYQPRQMFQVGEHERQDVAVDIKTPRRA